MAYLGRNPAIGTQKVLDSLESQFNGVLTTFNLRYTSNVVYPTLSSSLIVSLGGVLQEPGTAYTVASDQITFASAPGTGTDCWILLYSEFGAQAAATPTLTVANNAIIGGELHGPANFIIDPAVIGNNTGTVEIKGNLTVQGTTTTINSTTVDLDTLSLGDNEKISLGAGGVGDNGGAVESDLEIYSDGTNAYFDSGFIASSASPNIYFRTSASTTLDTNALTILNSGKVGIGTDDPSQEFDVRGKIIASGAVFTNDDRANPTRKIVIGSSSVYHLRLYDPSNTANVQSAFKTDGTVGIGTASPTSYGNSQKTLVIEDDTNPAICISDTGQTKDWWLVGQGDGLAIKYADGGGSGSASNVISSAFFKNNGDVGIGQNSPGSKLDVNGLTKSGGFQANGNVTPTAGHGVEIFAPSSSQGMIQAFDRTGGSQMELKFRGSDITFYGTSSSDERARITGAGDMALGTISPNTYTNYTTLTINGTTGGQIDFESNGTKYGGIYTQTNAFHVRNKQASGSGFLAFHTTNSGTCAEKLRIDSAGHVTPGGDDTQDLGSTSKRWRNIYTGDLQLSNEGSSNEVDGTWGNYTIQEGEEELFIINRRSGKKFKFVLEEVK